MRRSITLSDDAVGAIRAYARSHGLSMGKAASELSRRGCRYQLRTHERNGLPVFDVSPEFPLVTSERVRELLDEE